ncbi:hypothetical protein RM717_02085 [Streptomyces griseus]|uniref:Uncharacterized protein n=1 Tax=Streptomyces stephensoniae TaxID=3375367 RepID=A0ABU2VVL3_9ACTN|nr:hypothetical protein [Streptomyces griseus]MDT0489295.1 hypothetical protein [Streptomyces griseus]
MVQLTPLSSLPYPQPADAANIPQHLQSLASALDGRTVLRLSTTVALNSVSAPVTGMLAWVTNPGRYYYYTGSYWHPVLPTPVLKLNPVAGTTTSATYADALTGSTGDTMVTAFTAPPSGTVIVTVGARISSSVATATGLMSVTVKQGTTVTLATADTRAAVSVGTGQSSVSTLFQVSGLTGGVAYTATPAYRSSAASSTATFANRFLRVDPVH